MGGGGDLLEAWRISFRLSLQPSIPGPIFFTRGQHCGLLLGANTWIIPCLPASNSEDVPKDGKSVKGNVKAPPQTPQSTSSSNPQVMMPVHTCSSVGRLSSNGGGRAGSLYATPLAPPPPPPGFER